MIDKSAVIAYKFYDWIHSAVPAAFAHCKPEASIELKGEKMRKLAALIAPVLIIVIVLAAVGCGGEDSATPTATTSVTPTPATTPEPTAGPTVAPTVTLPPGPTPTAKPTEPPMPCRFYGEVKLNGAAVAAGTVITIIIAGDEYETTTPAVYGPSTYATKVHPVSSSAYADGTAVTFKVGGYLANQTGSWERGGNIEINLTASSS